MSVYIQGAGQFLQDAQRRPGSRRVRLRLRMQVFFFKKNPFFMEAVRGRVRLRLRMQVICFKSPKKSMFPHITTCVLILLYMCPHTTTISSYYYMRPLGTKLVVKQVHTNMCADRVINMCADRAANIGAIATPLSVVPNLLIIQYLNYYTTDRAANIGQIATLLVSDVHAQFTTNFVHNLLHNRAANIGAIATLLVSDHLFRNSDPLQRARYETTT